MCLQGARCCFFRSRSGWLACQWFERLFSAWCLFLPSMVFNERQWIHGFLAYSRTFTRPAVFLAIKGPMRQTEITEIGLVANILFDQVATTHRPLRGDGLRDEFSMSGMILHVGLWELWGFRELLNLLMFFVTFQQDRCWRYCIDKRDNNDRDMFCRFTIQFFMRLVHPNEPPSPTTACWRSSLRSRAIAIQAAAADRVFQNDRLRRRHERFHCSYNVERPPALPQRVLKSLIQPVVYIIVYELVSQ